MAPADSGAVKPLQSAMKMAKVAIQLEGENKHKDAYCEYLRTISYISHSLLEDAGSSKDKETVAVEIERMLRLAEQCLERTKSLIGKSSDPPDPPDLPASAHGPRHSAEPPHAAAAGSADAPDPNKDTSPSKPGHRRVWSDGAGELCPFLPPEVFQRLQTVASQDACRKELTPIEEASRLNQKLKANYEARVARLRPGQAYQKTSLMVTVIGRNHMTS